MPDTQTLLTPKLLDALYTEAMVLADEARSYFESGRFADEAVSSSGASEPSSPQDSALAVGFSCESLKVTTRLMHCIAWLLNQKAMHSGELTDGEMWNHDRALGYAAASDLPLVEQFPNEAQQIVLASEELFQRLQRLSARLERRAETKEPAVHDMLRKLQSSF